MSSTLDNIKQTCEKILFLIDFYERTTNLPSCNDCKKQLDCEFNSLSKPPRRNCPLHEPREKEGRIRIKTITPSKIVKVYKDMMKRQEYESEWVSPDGLKHITDTGYAVDGAFFFLIELLTELDALALLKSVEDKE